MIPLRKCWWSAAVLAAIVGCGNEQASTDSTAPPTTTTPAPTNPPAADRGEMKGPAPSATKDDASKDDMSKDESKGGDTKADEKKDGGDLKLDAPTPAPAKSDDNKAEDKKDEEKKDKTAAANFSPKELAAIKKLPPADQELAMAQVVCPVSGGKLGAMDKPYKVSLQGKTIFLCCDGCEQEVKDNPKAVLAKLTSK